VIFILKGGRGVSNLYSSSCKKLRDGNYIQAIEATCTQDIIKSITVCPLSFAQKCGLVFKMYICGLKGTLSTIFCC
jgi:hypothetical protein